MTRENKLALVVGFTLILLVGILISDHFSAARRQEPAQLGPTNDPLSAARAENPELIALRADPAEADPIDAAPRGIGAAAERDRTVPPRGGRIRIAEPVVPEPVDGIEMGGGEPVIGLAPAEAASLLYTFHHVRKGEYLSTICQKHYGDATLASAVARFNGLDDPDAVQAGQRLRLPKADALLGGASPALEALAIDPTSAASAPASTASPAPNAASAKHATYTVKDGDVLTEIASRLLGSAKRYTTIFEANRDQLDSPDDIRAGMKLRIPR